MVYNRQSCDTKYIEAGSAGFTETEERRYCNKNKRPIRKTARAVNLLPARHTIDRHMAQILIHKDVSLGPCDEGSLIAQLTM